MPTYFDFLKEIFTILTKYQKLFTWTGSSKFTKSQYTKSVSSSSSILQTGRTFNELVENVNFRSQKMMKTSQETVIIFKTLKYMFTIQAIYK